MKRFLSVILLSVSMSTFAPIASANTPQEVLTPYLDFKNSFFLEDYQVAAEHTYIAWQKAEELIGDDRETYILARNFANLNFNTELSSDRVIEAYLRSIDLADTREEKASLASALKIFTKRIDDKKIRREVRHELSKRIRKPYSQPFFRPIDRPEGNFGVVRRTLR